MALLTLLLLWSKERLLLGSKTISDLIYLSVASAVHQTSSLEYSLFNASEAGSCSPQATDLTVAATRHQRGFWPIHTVPLAESAALRHSRVRSKNNGLPTT
ncbi:hypothetical protein D3C80_897980 [compost metagenome]